MVDRAGRRVGFDALEDALTDLPLAGEDTMETQLEGGPCGGGYRDDQDSIASRAAELRVYCNGVASEHEELNGMREDRRVVPDGVQQCEALAQAGEK